MSCDDDIALRQLRTELALRFAGKARERDAPLPELRELQERLRLVDAAIADPQRGEHRRRRVTWLALLVVAAVLSLAALIPVQRMPFSLDAEAGAVRRHMDSAGELGSQSVAGELRVDGYTALESPDADIVRQAGAHAAGRLTIGAAALNLRRVSYPAGADIDFAAGARTATLTVHSQGAPTVVAIEMAGRTTMRFGQADARQADYPFAERVRLLAAGAGSGAPPPLTITLARPSQTEYGWTSLRPHQLRFVERILKEGNEVAILSSLRKARVVLQGGTGEINLGEGEDLELAGLELQRCDVLLGPVVRVKLVGSARSLLTRMGDFERSLKPSLLEHAARHKTVALFWSAGLFLWGVARWLQHLFGIDA